jgi:hypothetical protein
LPILNGGIGGGMNDGLWWNNTDRGKMEFLFSLTSTLSLQMWKVIFALYRTK